MNSEVPKHIAIIMDGNRRWEKQRGLPLFEGHRVGAETLEGIAKHIFLKGVKVLTFFAFSSENWNRSQEEVSFLMRLLEEFLQRERRFGR